MPARTTHYNKIEKKDKATFTSNFECCIKVCEITNNFNATIRLQYYKIILCSWYDDNTNSVGVLDTIIYTTTTTTTTRTDNNETSVAATPALTMRDNYWTRELMESITTTNNKQQQL